MDKETRYVGVRETLAYGFANAGQVFGYNLIAGGYLSLFFTKVFEIPPAAVSRTRIWYARVSWTY